MLGPLLAGIAIDLSAPLFPGTDGYAATWLVCGGAILVSIPALRRMRRAQAPTPAQASAS